MHLEHCPSVMIIYVHPYLKKSEGWLLIFMAAFLLGVIKLNYHAFDLRSV